MKIVALEAQNIKKLVAVEIRPDGNLVQITGKNGQGKTSVLDAIWWALAGARHIQATPIRKGENKAHIRLDLGELVVTRTFKEAKDGGFTTSIAVEDAAGGRFQSPQRMIDELLGALTFDPLGFARAAPEDQAAALRAFIPDFDFDAADAANRGDYDRRTEVNREAKRLRGQADAISVREGTPAETEPVADLQQRIEGAVASNATLASRIQRRADAEAQIDDLRAQATEAAERADELAEQLAAAGDLPVEIDVAGLKEELALAENRNREVGNRLARDGFLAEEAVAVKESGRLTEAMAARDRNKTEAVAAAKMPVEGISFGDGEVLLNGLPFNQASDAEQLRISLKIAMSMNPDLRVIRVRDGSLLDEESLALVAEMADADDYQVWIERVESSGKIGFVMEDGMVVGADDVPVKEGK